MNYLKEQWSSSPLPLWGSAEKLTFLGLQSQDLVFCFSMKSLLLIVLGFLLAFSSPLMAQEAEVVVNWEVFKTGTPAEVAAEIEKLPKETGLETKAKDDMTPLHLAASNNINSQVISILIKAGAELEARNKDGWTPLHLAGALSTSPEVISALIKAGARFKSRTEAGETPLHTAARTNTSHEVVSVLIEEINQRLRLAATGEDGLTPAAALDAKVYIALVDGKSQTAIGLAARYNTNPEVISVLIRAGASPNTSGDTTPLHHAARYNTNPEVISVLIKAGAKLEKTITFSDYFWGESDWRSWTPLYFAVHYNTNPEVISVLIKAGADVKAKDINGIRTVVFYAKYHIIFTC